MSRILAVLLGCSLVAGLLTAPPAQAVPNFSAGSFHSVGGNPERVLDTRSGLGGRLGAVASRHTVTAIVTRHGGWASAAVIKVTVPGNAPAGSLSVYPSGAAWSGRVTVSLVGGSTISQQLHVRLGADGGVTVRNNSARALHLIVEVMGFYQAGTPTEAGTFAALDSRILDTRAGTPLLPGRRITLAMPGLGGIPGAGASAVVLNIAVLSARATGLLGVTDGDGSQATVHMRFLGNPTAPQSMQTQRVVRVGKDGRLAFSQSSAAGVHLVIDLMGYFLPQSAGSGAIVDGIYIPVSPQPVTTRVAGSHTTQLRLYQHRPLDAHPKLPAFETLAYNIVLSPDNPGQPTLLGLYNDEVPWTPTVTLSSTPARQPTELTVYTGALGTATLINLSSATWTYLHGYLTGYYWYFHCVAC